MSSEEIATEPQPANIVSNCHHTCIEEIVRHNIQIDDYFFDKSSMRVFSSRILPTVYGGRFFVTSEQDKQRYGTWDGERRYTVRECVNGRINDCSEFGEFATAQEAKKAARYLVALAEAANNRLPLLVVGFPWALRLTELCSMSIDDNQRLSRSHRQENKR